MPWSKVDVGTQGYVCGFCDHRVASKETIRNDNSPGRRVWICPHCESPTYFSGTQQTPGAKFGSRVDHLPADVDALYGEIRQAIAAGAHTAAVLAARKLLMHIAVAQGAAPGETFAAYIDHLEAAHFIPPNGKAWVDHVRKRGNEANHEIAMMKREDAELLVTFLGMLLRFIYEFPKSVPPP